MDYNIAQYIAPDWGQWQVQAYVNGNSLGSPTSFQVTGLLSPSITPGGIVPIDGTSATIQAGEWVSMYGANLAGSTASWNGDFPVALDGTSVTVNGKSAYLSFVSPGQINFQAPNDTATGVVLVGVTTGSGSTVSTVTLAPFAPSFLLLDTKHVAGIIVRANGSGAYGGGAHDIIGPSGTSLGYPTVAAKAGDTIELFGTGFGPTNPAIPAGDQRCKCDPGICGLVWRRFVPANLGRSIRSWHGGCFSRLDRGGRADTSDRCDFASVAQRTTQTRVLSPSTRCGRPRDYTANLTLIHRSGARTKVLPGVTVSCDRPVA